MINFKEKLYQVNTWKQSSNLMVTENKLSPLTVQRANNEQTEHKNDA